MKNSASLSLSLTHKLIDMAINELTVPFSTVFVGDDKTSFEEWRERPFKAASIEELLDLKNKSHETWSRVQKLLSGK